MKSEPFELTLTGELVSYDFGDAFDEIIKPDGRREITLSFDSPDFKQRMEWYAQGFQLWREWFGRNRGPIIELNGYIELCFFCGGRYEDEESHKEDCIYIRAKKLIEEADGVMIE